MKKPYNLESRFVDFVSSAVSFVRTIGKIYEEVYFKQQLLRSVGGSALNYGEATGSISTKDFVHKCAIVFKELKETRMNLKILDRLSFGDTELRLELLNESEGLVAIIGRMIRNKS
jgi:four helix bundle protein